MNRPSRFFVCVVILALGVATGCDAEQARREQQQNQLNELRAQEREAQMGNVYWNTQPAAVPRAIRYIRDLRTGYCFAYFWAGDFQGGPAFTYVPCENIPANILETSSPTSR